MAKSQRIESIDFWRGLALLVIFVDHVPGNPLATVTPRNFGFSDATEAFIFLSGLALACAYWRKFRAGETGNVAWRCLRRALQIYGTHIAICAAFLAIFGVGYLLTHNIDFLDNDGRRQFFMSPLTSAAGLLTLGFQIGYVNILPVYIALLLMAPPLMILLRRRVWLGLGASAAVYMAAQFGLQLPSWPWPNTWFLDPFAWQLMFTLGLIAGIRRRDVQIVPSIPALAVASGILLLAFVVETNGLGFASGLSQHIDDFGTNKQLLGIGRLVHFLSLAYLLTAFDVASVLLRLPSAQAISRLGRHGLTIFAAGSVFSAFGQLILGLCHAIDNRVIFDAIGLLIVTLGIFSLVFLAQLLEWQKSKVHSRVEALPQTGVAVQA